MNTPYLYKMVNKETNEFYIGCRYTEGCNPTEPFEIYASSSRLVKGMIRDNPDNWEKHILLTGSRELVQIEESALIKQYTDDPLCLNGITNLNRIYKKRKTVHKELDLVHIQNAINNLGRKIKRVRKDNKISQTELCDVAGISRVTLHRLENGHNTISLESLLRIMFVLDLEFDL